ARVLERRFRLGDARVRRLDLDPGLSGGALQGHEREAALLELVLPLGLLRREGRRVVLQRAHLLDERRGLTARFLDLRRGAPGPFAGGAEPGLDLRRIHLPPDSLLPRCLLLRLEVDQLRALAAPPRLRLSHLLRERFQLGAALERPPARRRGSRQEHRTIGPSQRAPPVLPALEDLVAGEERANPRGRGAVHTQVVLEGMAVRGEPWSGHAR